MDSIKKVLSTLGWQYVLAALIALPIAFLSARSAAVGIFDDRLPAQALSLDSADPVALMKQIDSDLGIGGLNKTPKANWRPDAVISLSARPMNPPAIRVLGLVAAGEGRQSEARTLIKLAERISRRDGLAQLWLLQDSAKRDDARAALMHMDMALSVHSSLQPTVFPTLLSVIEDPRYAQEFAKFVVQDRPWLLGFLTFANTNNPNPEALADVVSIAGGLPSGPDYRAQETNILWTLANARQLDRAAKLLVQLRRATPATLVDGRVSGSTVDPKLGPFAWSPSMDADVSSAFEAGGVLRATIAPGKTGMILQRYLALSQGTYSLTAKARSDIEDAEINAGLTVECTAVSYILVYEGTSTISSKGGGIGGPFIVPPNCPLQLVRFTARSADSKSDGALTLSNIKLEKTN